MAVYVPTGVDLVTIRAIDPPGPTVVCRHGDGLAKWSSSAGWQYTKRPKRTSMSEWMGRDPYTLTVPIQFGSGFDDTVNVDPVVEVLRGIMRNSVGPRNEPAVVTIACPLVPLNWLKYVINDLTEKESLRNEGGGHYFASYDLILYQWEPTDLTIASSSGQTVAQKLAAAPVAQSSGGVRPAAPAAPSAAPSAASSTVASSWTYTVKSGDTLSAIAARQLGDASRWTEIAGLNGIRDPRKLQIGQVLRMPGNAPITTTYGIPGYGPTQGHGPSGTTGVPGYAPGQGHGPSGIG